MTNGLTALRWRLHRWQAMQRGELLRHGQRRLRSWWTERHPPEWSTSTPSAAGSFPYLPDPAAVPSVLRVKLQDDLREIRRGQWTAFADIRLSVDQPPRWDCDYLARQKLPTDVVSHRLNHRTLPGGADIKLIWELSRWTPLVRLAMGTYLLGDVAAGEQCLACLENWSQTQTPFRGWNWTSALESGLRLIQWTWIHGLLSTSAVNQRAAGSSGAWSARLDALSQALLGPHVWFTWQQRSFGSSANNHLMGELAGLLVASARWPGVADALAPVEKLQSALETEIIRQFASDGGNQEQALNYHLFSWELCWQARAALKTLGRSLSAEAGKRLERARHFFAEIQVEAEPWDYGDSDSATVTPFYLSAATAALEWRRWFIEPASSPAIQFWWSTETQKTSWTPATVTSRSWRRFPESGYAVRREGPWTARWDLSPLGLPPLAAHGHLDALHLSLWFWHEAFVVDPGTGAYFGDVSLRRWLASRRAHNGPTPKTFSDWPIRRGTFLWKELPETPVVGAETADGSLPASQPYPEGLAQRVVRVSEQRIDVDDSVIGCRESEFSVRWQFAPECEVRSVTPRQFSVRRGNWNLEIVLSPDWAGSFLETGVNPPAGCDWEKSGVVSRSFRTTQRSASLRLVAPPGKGVFRTTFLATTHA